MFESLDTLKPEIGDLFFRFRPISDETVTRLYRDFPHAPSAYISFLKERGYGVMGPSGNGQYEFFDGLVNVAEEVYGDDRIFEISFYGQKAVGPVFAFANDDAGMTYAFDLGDAWSILEIEADRSVNKLRIDFKNFVRGMVACFPRVPFRYESGYWFDRVGNSYKDPEE